jgi:hypothetical protein
MTYYVYAHAKPDNTLFYIGKGTRQRAWSTRGRNAHWQHTVAKYGYEVILLADGLTQAQAIEEEAAVIAHFRPFGTLVNILDRGDIAPSSHPDVAAAISKALLGIKRSDETRAKLRALSKTPEARAKMSAAAKLRVVSEETRAKLSAIGKTRKHSEETKIKMSAAALLWQKGRTLSAEHKAALSLNNPWRGKKRPEHAALMQAKGLLRGEKNPFYGQGDRQRGAANHMATAVVGVHPVHGEKRWGTLKAASDELGVSLQAISQAIRRQARSKGWAFRKEK